MRKIILGVAVTLDGFIEGPKGEYDWCMTDQDYGMTDFLKRIDTIFIGRKSYEVAGGNPYPDKTCYLFSNTIKEAREKETRIVSSDAISQVRKIKEEKGKDIWLFGGASLTSALINEDLVDELWLSIHPILLGKGKLLFQDIGERKHFRLKSAKTYETGLLSVVYEK
jgi:dihydrofolate reductase